MIFICNFYLHKKSQIDSLWAVMGEQGKYHLVDLDSVCSSIQPGGVVLRRLGVFRKAVLVILLCRYAKQGNR